MDVLSPSFVNIDGRIYCVYNTDTKAYVGSDKESENFVEWDDEPSCYIENLSPDVKKISEGK